MESKSGLTNKEPEVYRNCRGFKVHVTTNGLNILKKFPAAARALDDVFQGENWPPKPLDTADIRVERFDRGLLFYKPVLCSGAGLSLYDEKKPELLGWEHERFFPVDKNHVILDCCIGQSSPDEKKRDSRQLRELVESNIDRLSYIVRIKTTGWCKRIPEQSGNNVVVDLDRPFGELVYRAHDVTVYREPAEGFAALLSTIWSHDNFRLHFESRPLNGSWVKNPEWGGIQMQLQWLVEGFENRVHFNDFCDKLTTSGTCEIGDLGAVTYSFENWAVRRRHKARLVDIDLTKGDVAIKLRWDERCARYDKHSTFWVTEPKLEIKSIKGTLKELRLLLEQASEEWEISRVLEKASES